MVIDVAFDEKSNEDFCKAFSIGKTATFPRLVFSGTAQSGHDARL